MRYDKRNKLKGLALF